MKSMGLDHVSLSNRAMCAQFVKEIYVKFFRKIGASIMTTKQERSEAFCADCVMELKVSFIGCLPRSKQRELSKMLLDTCSGIGSAMKCPVTGSFIRASANPKSVVLLSQEAGGRVEEEVINAD